jgi:ABC-type phosphate transport system substrate-binding protein
MKRGGLYLSVAVAFALVGMVSPAPAQKAEVGFKVIVNAENPIKSLTGEQVSRIFLKKTLVWDDDVTVMPVDLSPESEVRSSFSLKIHGRAVASVKSYWQQMIFSGRDIPPPERATEEQVLELIRSNRGGIGYVAATTEIGKGIKVLEVSYASSSSSSSAAHQKSSGARQSEVFSGQEGGGEA